MKGKNLVILNVVLLALAAFLAYKIYQVIMEPIQFERIKKERFCAITERMEKVREAELAYKEVYGEYTGDWNTLINFVDTAYITIYSRKDSSFQYYNKRFQKDMNKDTIVVREIGKERVLDRFGEEFDPEIMKEVPMTEDVEFDLGAGKIERNGVTVPVFEVSVPDTEIFKDLKKRFDQYIDKEHRYQIGSLTEATISGNYENTKCKDGIN